MTTDHMPPLPDYPFDAEDIAILHAYARTYAEQQMKRKPAIEAFAEFGACEEKVPLERLRAFCSFAMQGQDWLDVEQFFDACEQQTAELRAERDALLEENMKMWMYE